MEVKCETFHYQNNVRELLDYIDEYQPDVVSNAVIGEDGIIGLLDLLQIPYIGSGAFSSMTTDSKYLTKLILKDACHHVPDGFSLRKGQQLQEAREKMKSSGLSFPIIVKPNTMGSKIGITYVVSSCELEEAIKKAFQCDDVILVEEFIEGRELCISVIVEGKSIQILKPIETLHEDRSADFMINEKSSYVVARNISDELNQKIQDLVEDVVKEFELTSLFRIDVIEDSKGELFVLEVTTAPGLSSTSVFPKAALASGISRKELIRILINSSLVSENDIMSG